MAKKKQSIFEVLTKPKQKTDKFKVDPAQKFRKRTPKQVLELIKQLDKHLKDGGSIQDFCFKVGISTRQMREHRAKYRVNPNMFEGK